MRKLEKLHTGDAVAIVSPSFAAPGQWPHVYELGLRRVREVFGLEPVVFPTTAKLGASTEERARDIIRAFEDPHIRAVIASLGGDDQGTYIHRLPREPFQRNPKPFFGYSDNTHLANFLWLCGVPSFYGGSLFVQFAEQGSMHPFTTQYLQHALLDAGEIEIHASPTYNDIGLDWDVPENLHQHRHYEPNAGWFWDGASSASGVTWGGCLESLDELLRHDIRIPTLRDFENIVLFTETSELIPSAEYVQRVYQMLGQRGILERVAGVLVGRPKAWEFDKPWSAEQKEAYRKQQRAVILEVVRQYHPTAPVVQNLDFGHTDPQIPMPYGSPVRIDAQNQRIFVQF